MIAVRRFVIFVAQIMALVFIVVSTLAGSLLGDWLLNGMPIIGTAIIASTSIKGISLFGGIAGFLVSTMLAAVFFLLVEVAYNTRNPFNT